MRGDEKLIETYGLSWERDIQNGVRYWMPQLNIKIDIFTTESWGIVGRSKFGKGVIERDIETKIPGKDDEIILYCGGGFRSALAAEALQKMGYRNVESMDGGFREWREASLPIETE